MRIRIHELAKELGFENKDFLDNVKKIGIDVKSHLSGLDEEQEKKIREKIKSKKSFAAADKKEKAIEGKTKSENHIVKEKIIFTKQKERKI